MLEVEMPLRFILSMMLSIFFSPWWSKLLEQSDGLRHDDDPQGATLEVASPPQPTSCSTAEQHPAIKRLYAAAAECSTSTARALVQYIAVYIQWATAPHPMPDILHEKAIINATAENRYPIPDTQKPISDTRYPKTDIRCPISKFRNPTPDIHQPNPSIFHCTVHLCLTQS